MPAYACMAYGRANFRLVPVVLLSTLCQRCGLCCDGTLFTHVSLQRDEAAALRQKGVEVIQRANGAPALAQRCAALDGCRCTVYAERPQGCRSYQCLLYAALAEGEVALDEALGIVDQARALVAATPFAEEAVQRRVSAFLEKHFLGRHGHGTRAR